MRQKQSSAKRRGLWDLEEYASLKDGEQILERLFTREFAVADKPKKLPARVKNVGSSPVNAQTEPKERLPGNLQIAINDLA